MARDFKGGFEIAVYARTVYVRRVVEREGVSKFPRALSRKASVHAATFSHFSHIEPRRSWVGHRRGEETAPCLAVRRGEAGARAGLASAGRSADAPACGQAVGSRLARTKLDFGRTRWVPGNAEWIYGKAESLSDCNTCFICYSGSPVFGKFAAASQFSFPTAGAARGHYGLAAAKISRRGTSRSFQTGALRTKNYLMLWSDVIMDFCDGTHEQLFV